MRVAATAAAAAHHGEDWSDVMGSRCEGCRHYCVHMCLPGAFQCVHAEPGTLWLHRDIGGVVPGLLSVAGMAVGQPHAHTKLNRIEPRPNRPGETPMARGGQEGSSSSSATTTASQSLERQRRGFRSVYPGAGWRHT